MEFNRHNLQIILAQSTLSAEDRQWLLAYLQQPGVEEEAKEILQAYYQQQQAAGGEQDQLHSLQTLQAIHQRLALAPVRTGKPLLMRFATWLAAASVLAAVSLFALWKYVDSNKKQLARTSAQHSQKPSVKPATMGAILTLSDGKTIVLDDARNGTLTDEQGASIIKEGNRVIYNEKNGQEAITYNTMTTPNGRQFQLMLSDGTRVWLNAASSIRFPTVFSGSERAVEVTGEVYFEVKKDPARPFRVKTGNNQVEVLGTHFNVNGYDSATRITLLEGSVKVVGRSSAVLKPGQQAVCRADAPLKIDHVDVDVVVAWKSGHFIFEDADLQSLMRHIARWYDVRVVYEDAIPQRTYSADISPTTELNDLLKVLEETGVHFRLEGKTLFVHK